MFTAHPMAKVNLTLDVVGMRADGFHDLRSVFVRIALSDALTVTAGSGADALRVDGLPGAPETGNLVVQAFELLRRRTRTELPALSASLHKDIPTGAGLGGGSSDASAALDLAAAAWGIGLAPNVRAGLALDLGSDVPFFASGAAAALVEGRGERVMVLPPPVDGALLLAVSREPLSTATVFARYDELRTRTEQPGTTDALGDGLERGLSAAAFAALAAELRDANDLWPAAHALMPSLGDRRARLERSTGRPWLLSGSGPTQFAIYESLEDAVDAGQRLAANRPADLRDVILFATGLEDPDTVWRETWPSEA